MRTKAEWQAMAASLVIESRAFIAGEYVTSQNSQTFTDINPATGEVLAQVVACHEADVAHAVQVAKQQFEAGCWSALPARERKRILLAWAALLREHAEELALLETLDTGKPIGHAQAIDINNTVYCVQWFAEAIDKISGDVPDIAANLHAVISREPMGVVAAIVPWNFPLMMASWKFAPALAAGNSVILKPSEKSPLTAIRVAGLAKQAGIPDGVFQVLPGDGSVGAMLAQHMDVDCVTFTGSTAVGRKIAQASASSNLKRIWLELGGKSANIVMADADLQAAAEGVAAGVFFNQGEMCSAGSRVLVQRAVYPQFIDLLEHAAKAWQPADPLEQNTLMGAIIDRSQFDKVMGYIAVGREEAELIFGGEAVSGTAGWFIQPTLFVSSPDTKIAREEIFGPVCTVILFDDEAQALQIANDSIYGLGAGIWTQNIGTAYRMSRKLRAGSVWINCYEESGDQNLPFGGYKQSGNGRDKSLHALDKYMEIKTTLLKI
ncbi:aldehyde dehydrogenase [Tolumonas lignilytica]|uniref:aldehyde dehydrogenase n=1 Tax=Tolumonas lignilytica TaxID=1283284 RepID=UPI0004662CB6|nr:aldehyde dehydrogenase [Tolumonas lignilytica]